MPVSLPVVEELGSRLHRLGWVTDLLVAGSLATGDYTPGVSDLDLVALVDGPVGARRRGARGEAVTSPRVRTALIAWRDARRTVALARS